MENLMDSGRDYEKKSRRNCQYQLEALLGTYIIPGLSKEAWTRVLVVIFINP